MKILFHHLAKTAGTSLIEQAELYFDGRTCSARYDHELTDQLIVSRDYEFYHGHYSFNSVQRFKELNPDAFIFTFLRHPFNRVLSQYYNWVDKERVYRELNVVTDRGGPNALFLQRREKFEKVILRMTLDDFLTSSDPDVLEVTFNHQAGYMSDERDENIHRRLTRSIPNVLLFYDFAGLMEFYEPCLRLLEAKLSLPPGTMGGQRRSNSNDKHKPGGSYHITGQQYEILSANNLYDAAAFSAAYTRLLKDYSEFLPKDAADLYSALDLPEIEPTRFV